MKTWSVLSAVALILGAEHLPDGVSAISNRAASAYLRVHCLSMLVGAAAAVDGTWRVQRREDVASSQSPPLNGPNLRVGMLAQGVYWKGLFRDVEIVTWALTSPHMSVQNAPDIGVSIFYTTLYKTAEAAVSSNGTYSADHLDDGGASSVTSRLCVPKGTDMREWLRSLDVFITFESPLLAVLSLAIEQGVQRAVLVLNVDWAVDKELRILAARLPEKLDFWVKGPATQNAVVTALVAHDPHISKTEPERETERNREERKARVKEMVLRVPWTIPDAVVMRRSAPVDALDALHGPLPVTFLMIVGMGGVQSRRGVDIALRAFHTAMKEGGADANLQLLISTTLYPFPVEAQLLDHPNVTILHQVHAREELADLLAEADAMLYPSRWEGFGLTMMEALHAGVPVIVTDGWPMNELVAHDFNGLLVEAANTGAFVAEHHTCTIQALEPSSCRTMLSPHWEVREPALAQAILRFARSRELRRKMTAPDAWGLLARQRAFALVAQRLLVTRRLPSALVLFDCGKAWLQLEGAQGEGEEEREPQSSRAEGQSSERQREEEHEGEEEQERAGRGAPRQQRERGGQGGRHGGGLGAGLLLHVSRAHGGAGAGAVSEVLALVSAGAREQLHQLLSMHRAPFLRSAAYHVGVARVLHSARLERAAAEHYILAAARLQELQPLSSAEPPDAAVGKGVASMLALAAMLLIEACEAEEAGRAAAAALRLLRPHHLPPSRPAAAHKRQSLSVHRETHTEKQRDSERDRESGAGGGRVGQRENARFDSSAFAREIGVLEGEYEGVWHWAAAARHALEVDDGVIDTTLRHLQRVQGPTCAAALRELCVGEGQPRPAGTVSQGPIVFSLALLQKEWLRQPLRSGLSAHGLREQEDLPSL